MSTMPYRIVVCDDCKNVRDFLRYIIKTRVDLNIVAEGSSGSEAVSLCKTYKPDLILIDIEMKERDDGIFAIKKIRNVDSNVKIIVLTAYSNDEFIINAFKNGADNFIMKELPPDNILEVIYDTMKGSVWLSPVVAQKLKKFITRGDEITRTKEQKYIEAMKALSMLTRTEIEILLMVRKGYSRREISDEKVVSLGTVKTHITNILKKLDYNNMKDAIKGLETIGFFTYISEIG